MKNKHIQQVDFSNPNADKITSGTSNMFNLKINKDLLLSLYTDKVNEIAEDLPEKTFFKLEEVVSIISNLIENNPNIIQNE